jgi:hypothetical protein
LAVGEQHAGAREGRAHGADEHPVVSLAVDGVGGRLGKPLLDQRIEQPLDDQDGLHVVEVDVDAAVAVDLLDLDVVVHLLAIHADDAGEHGALLDAEVGIAVRRGVLPLDARLPFDPAEDLAFGRRRHPPGGRRIRVAPAAPRRHEEAGHHQRSERRPSHRRTVSRPLLAAR